MAKPKRINYKALLISLLVCIAAAFILLTGLWTKDSGRIAGLEEGIAPGSSADGSVQPTEPPLTTFDLSVWVVCWDWEKGLNDVNSIAGMPDSIQAFAASFDAADRLFLTDDAEKMVRALGLNENNNEPPVYLTVSNDRLDQNGEWTEEDGRLLDRLMATDSAIAKHIEDIVSFARAYGFDGVEIDYRNINGNALSGYAQFCSNLNSRLQENGMDLRVVLRPDSSIPEEGFPEGPQYVMTAFNFYGTGSQPGPNADEPFINSLAAILEKIPGERRIAFATGGYDWNAAGNAQLLTETEAYNLSLLSGEIKRDVNSGEIYFNYTAEDGSEHTVWYADSETIAGWFNLSKSLGYLRVGLWRMGGEMPGTLELLGNLKGAGLN